MDGIIKLYPFKFPKIKDLFIKSENSNGEEKEKEDGEEEMPKWAKKLLEAVKPKDEATDKPSEVPVPPAPAEDEDDDQPELENPIKKLIKYLW